MKKFDVTLTVTIEAEDEDAAFLAVQVWEDVYVESIEEAEEED